ncbi:MAG: response regulator [Gammaproteobacteria bacterium]|nr:response regulator [Gammaproteobacteria bacterium]
MSKRLNLCHYPTTAVFIDDNQAFLDSLPLELDESLSYLPFIDPKQALDYINMEKHRPMAGLSAVQHSGSEELGVRIDLQAIIEKVHDDSRFLEPSVIVIDFDLPTMDGLELCRQIDDPCIKKILLTGVADECVGVAALNDRIIDYYVKKSAPNMFAKLNSVIRGLQVGYFNDATYSIRETLETEYVFFNDPAFIEYFADLCNRLNVAEYYFTPSPQGFLLVTSTGHLSNLIVYSESDIDAHCDIALDLNAPDELIEKIRSKQWVPYFPDSSDGYYQSNIKNWEKSLLPTVHLEGEHYQYYCAQAPAIVRFPQPLMSYDRHLRGMAA